MIPLTRKTLIVTFWAPPMVGGPQNLYNLFSQYDKGAYVVLTTKAAMATDPKRPGTPLPGEYVFYDSTGDRPSDPQRLPLAARQNLVVNAIRRIPGASFTFYAWLTINRIRQMVHAGVRTVREKHCEIVMGISDIGPALLAAPVIAWRTKKPYALYLYDIYKGNNLGPFERTLAALFERIVMRRAERVILTNEGTEEFYQRRYGGKLRTAVVHNSVFGEAYERTRTPFEPRPPYTILFTGHVYWAQEQSVLNLIAAMDQLRDLPLRLDLYIPKASEVIRRAVTKKPNILLTEAPQSAMPEIQSKATLLFLPLAWGTKSPDIIATATPGKFTDYLASGRPMLVHAPSEAYVAKSTKEHRLGLVVDVNDVAALADAIRHFLTDPSIGRPMVDRAVKMFRDQFEAKTCSQRLAGILNAL